MKPNESEFSIESFCDDLGPAKIVHLYDSSTGMRGIIAIDNVAKGPSIGGLRMAPDVSTEEVFRLARAMTLKNAAAGLPHGGGKAGIVADPKSSNREALIRSFGRAMRDLSEYIVGPDMGTDETCMAWIQDEIGKRSVGLPRVLGGIPLDEIGATGFGLARCAEVAGDFAGVDLKGARFAIEGYGNVGRHAANFLKELGAVLVAASDSRGAIFNEKGIDIDGLTETKEKHGRVDAFGDASSISHGELFTVPCEILVPAARPDCIHADNAEQIEAKLILQGANIPATAKAEEILAHRGVISVPDFICNAGGVICASVEYRGGTEANAFAEITEKIQRNTREVLTRTREENVLPRTAAVEMAEQRVRQAMNYRLG